MATRKAKAAPTFWDDPAVQREAKQSEKLKAKRAEVAERIEDLSGQVSTDYATVSTAVAELIDGPEVADIKRQLDAARDELHDIDVATTIQQKRLTDAQRTAGNKVRADAKPAHDEKVTAIVKAAEALDAALMDEREFRHSVSKRSGGLHLPALDIPALAHKKGDGRSIHLVDCLIRAKRYIDG